MLVRPVMIEGWPIAHRVFAGNSRDSSTVAEVLQDLQGRFGLRRVVFVGDRGMVTAERLVRRLIANELTPSFELAPRTAPNPSSPAMPQFSRHAVQKRPYTVRLPSYFQL